MKALPIVTSLWDHAEARTNSEVSANHLPAGWSQMASIVLMYAALEAQLHGSMMTMSAAPGIVSLSSLSGVGLCSIHPDSRPHSSPGAPFERPYSRNPSQPASALCKTWNSRGERSSMQTSILSHTSG
eukprot:Lithocolla_globosa_v1_NODE_3605_length_1624_cov_55.790312.p2 type:complete len:128 gc:universal NODE_3605_length_1624_cov_55.790312:1088-1471(+)